MSDWFYISLAVGLTWVVLAAYAFLLLRRSRSAADALRRGSGGER
jgi:hypothetical protein